jgi:hypothetical protein
MIALVRPFAPPAVPTLVVGGAPGPNVHARDASRRRRRPIVGGRLELLDCGHEISIELPQELAALLQVVVEEVTSRRSRPRPP